MIAYIIEIPKNQNWLMFNSVSLTNQSQIAKSNSGYIFILQGMHCKTTLTEYNIDCLDFSQRETTDSVMYSSTPTLTFSDRASDSKRLQSVSLDSSVFKADWLMSDDIICCFLDSCLHSVTRFEIASTDDLKNPIESGM